MERQDFAFIRVLLSTGCRRKELMALRVEDVGLDGLELRAELKGGRAHVFPPGKKAAVALDRYLRVRAHLRHEALPWLWLGVNGQLGYEAIEDVLDKRAQQAGLTQHIHPHLYCHRFSHAWMASGWSESGLMGVVGWRARAMIDRYGRSLAD